MPDEEDVRRLLTEFREKSEPLGVEVIRVESVTDAAQILAEWALLLDSETVVVASEVIDRAPGIGGAIAHAGLHVLAPASPAELRDAALGVSLARLAIAETGSALLSETSLEDRSVGMLGLAQAIICPTALLVATLDDAVPHLRRLAAAPGGAFSTLVTGPSRTADIERVLTVGVQGPGKVMTLFVDDL